MLKPGLNRAPKSRRAAAALCLAACLSTSGCIFGKKAKPPRVFTPAPIAAKVPPSPIPIDQDVAAPTLEVPQPDIPTPAPDPEFATLPPAPKPVPPKPPPSKPTPPVVVDSQPPPTPAKPVSVLTAAQQQQMTQQYDAHMGRARNALAKEVG